MALIAACGGGGGGGGGGGDVAPLPSASNTPTYTVIPTATKTATPIPTQTATATNTPIPSYTATPTATKTATPTPTQAATATSTPIPSYTATPTATKTATPTPTQVATATSTPTPVTTTIPQLSLLAGNVGGSGNVDGAPGAFYRPEAAVADGLGQLYVADTLNCTIRRIVISTGQVSTLAGKSLDCSAADSSDGTGNTARFNKPAGLTINGNDLYVADTMNRIIRRVNVITGATTTLAGSAGSSGSADGTGNAVRFSNPHGLAISGNNLYVADTDNYTIRTINVSTGVTTTLAGAAGSVAGSIDGTGNAARFISPQGLAISGNNLYVTSGNNIRKIDVATGTTTTLAGTNESGITDGSTGGVARFNRPQGLAINGSTLYVSDYSSNTIRTVNTTTGATTTLVGVASAYGGSADGMGSVARFSGPKGVTISGSNLYVVDYFNNTIRRVDIATGTVTTLAGMSSTAGSADGMGSAVRFDLPQGLTINGSTLYVADYYNSTIRAVNVATGVTTTLAGFAGPWGLVINGSTLYVAEYGNHTIRTVDITTGATTTLAGLAGSSGSADGTTGSDARFIWPAGLAISGNDLYVSDLMSKTIRKVNVTTGKTTTLAGLAGSSGIANGTGSTARFAGPQGLAISGNTLYVADGDTIRTVNTISGFTTTLAGFAGNSGSIDGTGSAARFNGPQGLAISGSTLYVADYYNSTIRKIDVATGSVNTVLGQAEKHGAVFGDAPGGLNMPAGLAIANGKLYITMQNGIVQAVPLP